MNAPTAPRPSLDEALNGDQRFQLLVDAIRDYAIYLLDLQGNVSSWNTGAQRFKGYAAEEIIGQHFSRFYTPQDRERGEPQRALSTALQYGRFESEAWRIRKDGSPFWANVVIDIIRNERGEPIGFAKITRDITERRRAQEEIERARDALAQAQKMEAIGRLTGGVAHDFNNLLTVIRSSAELLRRPGIPDTRRAHYVNAIVETAERAAGLTRQLLAFARRQSLRPEPFFVSQRLEGLAQIIDTTLGGRIVKRQTLAADTSAVLADPAQFDTALLNIAINARDAMPNGGQLSISSRNVDHVPPLRRHARVDGAFVAVSIEDTGTGIAPDTLDRIFEPFFTTKPTGQGTGLGLSQVYGFVKQSGGEIAVTSTVGTGTCFTLYLPRAANIPMPLTAACVQDIDNTLAPRKVLLVEDNETVGRFAHGLLAELGLSVTWATGAQAALAVLEAGRDRYDMVFSDVVMPGMSGIELGHEIRRRWPDLPVVLTSGYSHVLAEEGTHGFELLHKPYSLEGLLKALKLPARSQ